MVTLAGSHRRQRNAIPQHALLLGSSMLYGDLSPAERFAARMLCGQDQTLAKPFRR